MPTQRSVFSSVSDIYINGSVVSPAGKIEYNTPLEIKDAKRLMFEEVNVIVSCRSHAVDVFKSDDTSLHSALLIGGTKGAVACREGGSLLLNRCTLVSDSSTDLVIDADSAKRSCVILKDCKTSYLRPLRVAFGRFNPPKAINTTYNINMLMTLRLHVMNLVGDVFRFGKYLSRLLFNVKRRG